MKAIVYGKSNCMWCDRAIALLKEYAFVPVYRDVSDPVILAELKSQLPAVRSVPQIWIGDLYVGGYEDLNSFLACKSD